MDLKQYIRSYSDFPQPGILFRDISPLLASPEAFSELLQQMNNQVKTLDHNTIVGIDARGFIFGAALAQHTGKRFIMARKKGKLPGETISREYSYEYASAAVEIQKDLLSADDSVLIVDDVLATGNTLKATAELIEQTPAQLAGILTVIELIPLAGRGLFAQKYAPELIHSLIQYE
jgi:adenine phosphoribosyltransferase